MAGEEGERVEVRGVREGGDDEEEGGHKGRPYSGWDVWVSGRLGSRRGWRGGVGSGGLREVVRLGRRVRRPGSPRTGWVVEVQVTGASRWLPWMGVDWSRAKPSWGFQCSSWSSTRIEPPCWVLALRRRVAPWRAIRAVCVSRSQSVRILVADLGRMLRHRRCGAVSAVRVAEALGLRGLSPWPCHGGRG